MAVESGLAAVSDCSLRMGFRPVMKGQRNA
jgi:hypothetical protein